MGKVSTLLEGAGASPPGKPGPIEIKEVHTFEVTLTKEELTEALKMWFEKEFGRPVLTDPKFPMGNSSYEAYFHYDSFSEYVDGVTIKQTVTKSRTEEAKRVDNS